MEQLKDMYYQQKLGTTRIARRFGVSKTTILRWMRQNDLGRRGKIESQKYKRKDILKRNGRILKQDGYIERWNPDKQKYEREHRAIWEEQHGLIPSGYEIHHKNRIKTDNRIVNLELLEIGDHKRLHCKKEHSEETKRLMSQRRKEWWKRKEGN